MAEFSYASDIAPLRSTFFPASGMSRLERKQLDTRYAKEIAPIDEKNRALQKDMIKALESEDALEMQRLQLDEAKRVAKMKLDTDSRLPTLTAELDRVLSDPTTNTNQKALEFGKLSMRYNNLATYNPVASSLLGGAGKQIAAMKSIDEEKTREDAIKEQKRLSVIDSAMKLGDVGLVTRLTDPKTAGEVDLNSAYRDITTRMKELKDVEQQIEKTKNIYAQNQELRKSQYSFASTVLSDLRSMGRTSKGEAFNPSSTLNKTPEQLAEETQTEANNVGAETKFSDQDISRMKGYWISLNQGRKEEEMPKDPKDLYRTITSQYIELMRQTSAPPPAETPEDKGFGS